MSIKVSFPTASVETLLGWTRSAGEDLRPAIVICGPWTFPAGHFPIVLKHLAFGSTFLHKNLPLLTHVGCPLLGLRILEASLLGHLARWLRLLLELVLPRKETLGRGEGSRSYGFLRGCCDG